MRRVLTALAVLAVLVPTAPAHADSELVDHAEWVQRGALASLRVYPTSTGRAVAGRFGSVQDAERAWAELLARAPEAASPGMREQFVCHWQYAEVAQPGKVSWNLEPWRPVVADLDMLDSGCNPGSGWEAP